MKVLIDLSNHINIYTGITIYAQRIISGFEKNGYNDVIILCHPNIYSFMDKRFSKYLCIKAKMSTYKGVIGKLFNSYIQGKQINKLDFDILFRPSLSPSILFTTKKTVQTIHDMQGLKIGNFIEKPFIYIYTLIAILKSLHIITISNYVKKDVIKYYPFIRKDKLVTIYNSVVLENSDNNEKTSLSSGYILYVSMIREYKNLLTLLKAFNKIKHNTTLNLIIIGRPMGSYLEKVILPYINNNNLSSRITMITEHISNELLIKYYKQADLLVHPSLLEGFGFTPIEAAMLHTPVLTSKEAALYETTMGLLNYYEPATDYNVLANRIIQVLENPYSKIKLKYIAKQFSMQYDECKQAEKVWNCFKKVL